MVVVDFSPGDGCLPVLAVVEGLTVFVEALSDRHTSPRFWGRSVALAMDIALAH
jgi:hypothetical protein